MAKQVREVVAGQVRSWRKEQLGWSGDHLARSMTRLGFKWDRTTVAKVESLRREVTVEELVALSVAMRVPPTVLLFGVGAESSILLAPEGVRPVHPDTAQQWCEGLEPPPGPGPVGKDDAAEDHQGPARFGTVGVAPGKRGAWWKRGAEPIWAYQDLREAEAALSDLHQERERRDRDERAGRSSAEVERFRPERYRKVSDAQLAERFIAGLRNLLELRREVKAAGFPVRRLPRLWSEWAREQGLS